MDDGTRDGDCGGSRRSPGTLGQSQPDARVRRAPRVRLVVVIVVVAEGGSASLRGRCRPGGRDAGLCAPERAGAERPAIVREAQGGVALAGGGLARGAGGGGGSGRGRSTRRPPPQWPDLDRLVVVRPPDRRGAAEAVSMLLSSAGFDAVLWPLEWKRPTVRPGRGAALDAGHPRQHDVAGAGDGQAREQPTATWPGRCAASSQARMPGSASRPGNGSGGTASWRASARVRAERLRGALAGQEWDLRLEPIWWLAAGGDHGSLRGSVAGGRAPNAAQSSALDPSERSLPRRTICVWLPRFRYGGGSKRSGRTRWVGRSRCSIRVGGVAHCSNRLTRVRVRVRSSKEQAEPTLFQLQTSTNWLGMALREAESRWPDVTYRADAPATTPRRSSRSWMLWQSSVRPLSGAPSPPAPAAVRHEPTGTLRHLSGWDRAGGAVRLRGAARAARSCMRCRSRPAPGAGGHR